MADALTSRFLNARVNHLGSKTGLKTVSQTQSEARPGFPTRFLTSLFARRRGLQTVYQTFFKPKSRFSEFFMN